MFDFYFIDLVGFNACSEYKPNSLEPEKTAIETSEMSIGTNEMCVMGQLQVGHSLSMSGEGLKSLIDFKLVSNFIRYLSNGFLTNRSTTRRILVKFKFTLIQHIYEFLFYNTEQKQTFNIVKGKFSV